MAENSTDTADLPPAVAAVIGVEQYETDAGFDAEMGYVWTSLASVENGNPLFWDPEVAEELTGGPIAPPSMLSVWFRPHHWQPGATENLVPLQVHFDLKEAFGLPEAVMTDNTITFGAPVRPGDRIRSRQVLRSVSGPKTTKLGTGRFWVIDVEYLNQRDQVVGVETYTGFGYKRESDSGGPSGPATQSPRAGSEADS
jgi:acyl dehydratase